MNRFDAMDVDLDAMHNDVRVDEENLGFVQVLFRVYNSLRKKSFRTFLPPKVIVPDAFSHFVKELIVWSPEQFRARKKHPAARSIDRGTRSYVFVKVHAPKRSRGSCKCDS